MAGVGRGNFVIAEEYEDEPSNGRGGNEIGNRDSLGSNTRDLTSVGPYARYTDVSPPQEYSHTLPRSAQALDAYGNPYTDNSPFGYANSSSGHSFGGGAYSEDGRQSPTDYYGRALSPGNVNVAEEYADFPSGMVSASQATAGKVPVQDSRNMSQAGLGIAGLAVASNMAKRRSQSPIENDGRREEEDGQRPGMPTSSSMPQLPPLGPGLASPLYGSFMDPQPGSNRNSLTQPPAGVNLNRRSSSAQPTNIMYGSKKTHEELKKAYADLARAAQVEQPPTPLSAGFASSDESHSYSGHGTSEASHGLMPPIMPERYVHGRPLSPLMEVETPDTMPTDRNRFSAALSGRGMAPMNGVSRPDLAVRQSSDTYPQHAQPKLALAQLNYSTLKPPVMGGSQSSAPSFEFPPPSPGVSLPESPASYAPSGPQTPRGFGNQSNSSTSTPEYRFKIQTGSAVSLDAPFPNTPERHPGPRTANGLAPPQAPYQQNRSSIASLSDAYDGI